jgi:hypothetical protein
VSKTSAFQLWRVTQTVAQVRVLEPGGALVSVPSGEVSVSGAAAPRSGGTLELAEPAGGWSATLNGTALQSVPSPAGRWAQAFRLPAGGGTLDISHSQLGRTLIVVLEALALLVVIGLVLPGARVPGESAAAAAGAGWGRADRRRPPGARPRETRRAPAIRGWSQGRARGREPSRGWLSAGRRLRAGPLPAGGPGGRQTGQGRGASGAVRAGCTGRASNRAPRDRRAPARAGLGHRSAGPGTRARLFRSPQL